MPIQNIEILESVQLFKTKMWGLFPNITENNFFGICKGDWSKKQNSYLSRIRCSKILKMC